MHIELPIWDVRTDNWLIPWCEYLYLMNIISMYKVEVLTYNRTEKLLEDYLDGANVMMETVMSNLDFYLRKNDFNWMIWELFMYKYSKNYRTTN